MSGDPPIFPGKLRDYSGWTDEKKDGITTARNTTQHNRTQRHTRKQAWLLCFFVVFFAVLPCVVFLPPAPEGMKESGRRNRNLVKLPLFTPAQQDLSPSPSHCFSLPCSLRRPKGVFAQPRSIRCHGNPGPAKRGRRRRRRLWRWAWIIIARRQPVNESGVINERLVDSVFISGCSH